MCIYLAHADQGGTSAANRGGRTQEPPMHTTLAAPRRTTLVRETGFAYFPIALIARRRSR
nr:hypothetical protein GCM10025699_14260 [Microbacterium flavescens]